MGKLSNSMWRLLGAQSTRNQSKSLSVIKEAETHTDWAAELADDAFVGEAEKLDIGSKPGDRAKFLALVREAAAGAPERRSSAAPHRAKERGHPGDDGHGRLT